MFKKFNWGHGILLTFCLWALLMAGFMMRAMQEHTGLVTAQAYEKGQSYEQSLNNQRRALAASTQLVMRYETSNNSLIISGTPHLQGKLRFTRASDISLDFDLAFQLNEKGVQAIALPKVVAGPWDVQAAWIVNGESYEHAEHLTIYTK